MLGKLLSFGCKTVVKTTKKSYQVLSMSDETKWVQEQIQHYSGGYVSSYPLTEMIQSNITHSYTSPLTMRHDLLSNHYAYYAIWEGPAFDNLHQYQVECYEDCFEDFQFFKQIDLIRRTSRHRVLHFQCETPDGLTQRVYIGLTKWDYDLVLQLEQYGYSVTNFLHEVMDESLEENGWLYRL